MSSRSSLPTYALYGEHETLPDLCHVERIRERAGPLGWEIEPHRHSALVQFLHVERGRGSASFDGERVDFGPNSIIFVPRYCAHGFRFDADTRGFVVTLPVATLTSALKDSSGALARLSVPVVTQISPAQAALFRALSEEYNRRTPFRAQIISAQINLLALNMAREIVDDPENSGHGDAVVPKFLELIEKHFREGRDLSFYSKQLGRSASHLNRLCTTALQRNASGLLRDRVILEARRELAYTTTGIAQIAYDLGFRDPAYFARVFRQENGISPRAFRSRVQDEMTASTSE